MQDNAMAKRTSLTFALVALWAGCGTVNNDTSVAFSTLNVTLAGTALTFTPTFDPRTPTRYNSSGKGTALRVSGTVTGGVTAVKFKIGSNAPGDVAIGSGRAIEITEADARPPMVFSLTLEGSGGVSNVYSFQVIEAI